MPLNLHAWQVATVGIVGLLFGIGLEIVWLSALGAGLAILSLIAHVRQRNISHSLHRAVERNDVAVIKAMVECGADANFRESKTSLTPLHHAVESGDVTVVETLIECGTDVNAPATLLHKTPLHYAVQNDDIAVVRALIAAGADLDKGDRHGSTPLNDAASAGNVAAIETLIAAGADVNASNPLGRAALHAASMKTLIAAGANVNARGFKGRTPLHEAAICVNATEIEVLIAAGANVNVSDDEGITPLHVAVASNTHIVNASDDPRVQAIIRGQNAKIEALLAAGANANARDHNGKTPMDIAVGDGNRAAIKALKEN